eukprot:3021331-Amphidinium_carterae.1
MQAQTATLIEIISEAASNTPVLHCCPTFYESPCLNDALCSLLFRANDRAKTCFARSVRLGVSSHRTSLHKLQLHVIQSSPAL